MPNRIIKESFWSSESLSRCSIAAQGFFARLLPLPDDHGCFDSRPAMIRARLFPLNYAQVTERQIENWCQELISVDCIRVWLHAGVRYGCIPSWNKHQQVRSLHHRKTPEPPAEITAEAPIENKGDINCEQVLAVAALNPNPNPNPPSENTDTGAAEKPKRFGEFGNVDLTEVQHAKLTAKANGTLEYYIDRFDRWKQEQPAKTRGRVAYLTISNWIDQDEKNPPSRPRASPVARVVTEADIEAARLRLQANRATAK